ncbi:MAG: carboxypeptidase-like regulatory domain-containing protein [Rhodothermales bacterium]
MHRFLTIYVNCLSAHSAPLRRFAAILAVGCVVTAAKPVSAQDAVIFGTVTDTETGEPLPGANVFLDQTTTGASTNDDGHFEVGPVAPGSYRVVVSMVGYTPLTRAVVIVPEQARYRADFEMEPDVIDLGGIDVEAERPRGWEDDLEHFKEFFIGTSDNARQTEILNPYVLDFTTEDGIFKARASSPLIIENGALGYRITVVIAYFWEVANTMYLAGPMHFEAMQPRDEEEAELWRTHRRDAYEGSYMHFLQSLIAGTLREDGFFAAHDIILGRNRERVEVGAFPIVRATERRYLYELSFDHSLYVEYGRQESRIRMARPRAIVHASGYIYGLTYEPPPPLVVSGAMSERRIADMVPRDYSY